MFSAGLIRLLAALALTLDGAVAGDAPGPLRPHPENSRYFTDGTRTNGSLRAIYLTGSHTWPNLIDRGPSDPPPQFDYDGYLDLLQRNNHNFIRLWSRHVWWYHDYGAGELFAGPLAWERTGPGNALDGKARFDLTKLSSTYFDRLRERVSAAGKRGIYVSVMLFGGHYEVHGGWRGNPFHSENNVNGISGDPGRAGNGLKSHTLDVTNMVRIQEAYVRKVIDTLADQNNVLFEISNEGDLSSFEWQQHWVGFIRAYEKQKAKQHPIGLTALYIDDAVSNNRLLHSSNADWISPFIEAKALGDLPQADDSKVSILDSDHWFVKELYKNPVLGRDWVWNAFCRGYNTILMEHLPPLSFKDPDYPLSLDDPGYNASRAAMGQTRSFADRISLASMKPRSDLSSTRFCLADPGREYLVYEPDGSGLIHLELEAGQYDFEFFDAITGVLIKRAKVVSAGGRQEFRTGDSKTTVLYLRRHVHD